MLQCPNCGGVVKFNIEAQKLMCDSCSSMFEAYSFQYNKGAEEETEYDVTVFKCTQCGGEIYSTDESIAGFCSYCGTPNVLESRLTKEKKPQYIIPFKRTKKQCNEVFAKKIKKAIFAPSAYKKAGETDSFRGIYMPYWLYDMQQRGRISVKSSTSHRSGDYIITDHYNNVGILDNAYNGVSYDASASFADDISSEIAPFNVKDITTFNPNYLSGFYADTADVPLSTYVETAKDFAKESTYNYIKKSSPMSGHSFDETKEAIKSKVPVEVTEPKSALFPVWFMSYRSGHRVAYATVNGQTGKVSADIPISIPKFMGFAAILSVVFFFLLQLFFTVTPKLLIAIISLFAIFSTILYNSEMKKIKKGENYEDDLGVQARMEQKRRSREKAQVGSYFVTENETFVITQNDIKNMKKKRKSSSSGALTYVGICMGVMLTIFGIFAGGDLFEGSGIYGLIDAGLGTAIVLASLVVTIIFSITSTKHITAMSSKKGISSAFFVVAALVIALFIMILKPVNDMFYYFAAIAIMGTMIFNLVDLILSYNLLATRPLPQFEIYKGGDDRA